MKHFFVYILASKKNGTLYVGLTSDIIKRIWEHKNNATEGFLKKYLIHSLVYYERHDTFDSAVKREKNIKKWKRDWKINLIQEKNLDWKDLYEEILTP